MKMVSIDIYKIHDEEISDEVRLFKYRTVKKLFFFTVLLLSLWANS